MKNDHPKTVNPPSRQEQLWQPLNEDQSQSISGGGPLLFANPFAYVAMKSAPGLAGNIGIGG